MSSQIETTKNLDALLVLCGESEDHSRSNHVNSLYFNTKRSEPLSLVLTGRGSGLSPKLPEEPEAVSMQRYLSSLGIPKERMYLETKSLDTLGNMVFSRPVLDQILSGYSAKRFGLVTDKFHMDRSMWAANRVFGSHYSISPLPAERGTSLFGKTVECAVKNAWRFDLHGIKPGDKESFERYMAEKHPFHVGNAPLGAYKLGIYLLKTIRK